MAEPPKLSADTALEDALNELAKLVQPAATVELPPFNEISWLLVIPYLLLLWASLRIYQIEPHVEEGGETGGRAKIIPLENGRKIFDYGSYIASSPGEDYGTYCTGKLIETAQTMIQILAARGAKRVGFTGHPTAQLAAWIESLENNIEVVNFYPSSSDYERCDRIRKQREKVTKQKRLEAEQRPF